jgi:hypothetical protein
MSQATKRGRPKADRNTITINELVVEFLSTKADNYNNEISYFKIVDPAFRAKLKPLFSLNDEGLLKMPIWVTDTKNEHILKVKAKFVNHLQEFLKNAVYIININFEFYHIEENNIKGYYAKITKVANSLPGREDEVAVNDDN